MTLNCEYLQTEMEIARTDQGNPDGEWVLYVRDSNGEWRYGGPFVVENGIGHCKFSFGDPISFNAFTCAPYDVEGWNGSKYLNITEIGEVFYDFGGCRKEK